MNPGPLGGGEKTGTGAERAPGPRFGSGELEGWEIPGRRLDLSRPLVMGILNLTPDSFSDGGGLPTVERAVDRAWELAEAGADILDVGGESTRPGARALGRREELGRILPFLEAVSGHCRLPISVDTRNASVARAALEAGAVIVNDVSGLRHDPRMAGIVAGAGAGLVLSHMRGTPASMMELADYEDVVGEVRGELAGSMELALEAGVEPGRIVVDPGIGFAKRGAQSLLLLKELQELAGLGRPILVGPSRKSFLGEITGHPPADRVVETVAACVVAFLRGARIFRVHDVGPVVRALAVARAIVEAGAPGAGEEEPAG